MAVWLVLGRTGWCEQRDTVPESPMLASIANEVADGKAASVGQFWSTVEKRKTPIIEPIPGDQKHVLATFVWNGTDDVSLVLVEIP